MVGRTVSRRRFIALAGCGIGAAALAGCSVTRAEQTGASVATAPAASATSTPTPRPTPPVRPRGREVVSLLPETPWRVDGVAIHSGLPGPRIMVLGGVHGNEPGGWLAAHAISEWQVERGSLLVFPRVNWQSAAAFVRTLPEFGDLNRLYPGHADGPPMARMAAAIVEAGRDFQPELLFDLHESWVFYAERGSAGGTAYIGQTVAIGSGATDETVDRIADVMRAVNSQVTAREELYLRGAATPRPGLKMVAPRTSSPGSPPSVTPTPGANGVSFSGTSSLAMARWIEGCVPVLVEMGQQDQPESRRSALHQLLVRTALDQSGML